MAGKYEPLSRVLQSASGPVEFTFDQLDELIGGLPASARTHRSWWGNTANTTAGHTRSWIETGYVVDAVDLSSATVRFASGRIEDRTRGPQGPRTSPLLDGVDALAAVLRRAGYASPMHAVAAHTVFLHPDTVVQTDGAALFPVVRDFGRRGQLSMDANGTQLLLDDNKSPTLAFCWAARQTKGPDVQFNHVYSDSGNPDLYTALWNICVTPAFLAKTTDGRNHPEVVAAIRRRSHELYGYYPDGEPSPEPPEGYDELDWQESPAPVLDLEATLRERLNAAPKSPPAIASREIGWLFSDWMPDTSLRDPG